MHRFRTRLTNGIRRAYQDGTLTIPKGRNADCGMRHQVFLNLLNKLQYKKKWNVRIQERYAHGEGVATYLARYMRGGPIKNRRILFVKDGQVGFDYRDNQDPDEGGKGKRKVMVLSVSDFVQRLLLHVPVPMMQTVRSYGVYGHAQKEDLALCRKQLGQPPVEEVKRIDWESYCAERGDKHPERCPVCGGPLLCTMIFHRGHAPPLIQFSEAA